jgi:HD-GYP domain-containing protein (c-di-GMP phosphodiesterase class II)
VATIIRFHHLPWRDGVGRHERGHEVPEASHLLNLADRIDVISFNQENILSKTDRIRAHIQAHSGIMFVPEHVEAFVAQSAMEYFWLDLRSPALDEILHRSVEVGRLEIGEDGVVDLARLLSHLVDFKSSYTSTHTAGVARTAEILAELMGLDEKKQRQILLAGFLHDVGKLAVPREILDKPQRLDEDEFGMIKGHAYYTRRIVETISGMREIADWAASHHEHLDGRGYPYHLRDLPLESRIVAVADVFTALTEDRPYRRGFPAAKAHEMLQEMVQTRKLDGQVVATLAEHVRTVDAARSEAQSQAREAYASMLARARWVEDGGEAPVAPVEQPG